VPAVFITMMDVRVVRGRVSLPFVLSALVFFAAIIHPTHGHGHMTSPRSRNWVAWEDGVDGSVAGSRAREYCTHCLNTNNGVCGVSPYNDYDQNLDSTGQPMPWISQGDFTEGDIITVKSYLDTHHNGHMEIRACAMGPSSTQECFDTPGNELTFVEDVLNGMPKDDNYPERGMYAGGQGGSQKAFEMRFKLPSGIYGDQVMLQWKYITANACSPPGYPEYFAAHPDLPSTYWTPGLGLCTPPYPNDGTRGTTWPEQFFNCAEISVTQGQTEPTISPQPTRAPITSSPTVTSAPNDPPTLAPTRSPTEDPPTYSAPNCATSYEMLLDMEYVTNIIQTDPPVYSIVASGGAAGGGGDTVSESQAYGVLTSAIALASLDPYDSRRPAVMEKFHGMFNGWKKMCENSSPAPCQHPMYCDGGNTACLPGWKHTSDLSQIVGTGSAPDGDEDAIVGMIIALKAVENDAYPPDWYEEVHDWTDRSCSQFLADNTQFSSSGSHLLLKLGSCWGGWDSEGNNPSYHSPGHYRMMRDFQATINNRGYSLPNLQGKSLTEAWDMLIDTSYKFLETTQCPNTGLVPNWALVKEVDWETLTKQSGSFSGSGTPQKEFGAEASRTMWRVAFDAAVYPAESEAQAGAFLEPLQKMMVEHFEPSPLNGWEYFPSNTLQGCDHVDSVFGSWNFIGFIFGPVYSALVAKIPDELFQGKSFSQQTMVDVTCDIASDIAPSESYYARSWQVISTMTLNGGLDKIRELFKGQTTKMPTVSPKPTSDPTLQPTFGATVSKQPTDPPVASPTQEPTLSRSPTANPVASPTKAPVVPTDGCCSQNYRDCSVTWCGTTQESCLACDDTVWISGQQTGCQAIWNDCINSPCCDGLECVELGGGYSQCWVPSGTPTTDAPTIPPTDSPTGSPVSPTDTPTDTPTLEPTENPTPTPTFEPTEDPTRSPTLEPIEDPTASPSKSPAGPPEGCFSNNYKDCVHPDHIGMDTCSQIWLPTGAQGNCVALWEECTGQESSCCGPATCFGDSTYGTCVPSAPTPEPTTSCTVCTDIETTWMANNGKDCTTSDLIDTKCNKSSAWIESKFCQQSCYEAGNGYDGDVCCDSATRRLRGGA